MLCTGAGTTKTRARNTICNTAAGVYGYRLYPTRPSRLSHLTGNILISARIDMGKKETEAIAFVKKEADHPNVKGTRAYTLVGFCNQADHN